MSVLKFIIRFVDWIMASFLYCFPYRYRSFTLLKALAKSNGNLFAIAFMSDNFRKRAIKKKQRTDTKKDGKRIKIDNFTRSKKKFPILLSQYWKNE